MYHYINHYNYLYYRISGLASPEGGPDSPAADIAPAPRPAPPGGGGRAAMYIYIYI